MASSISARPAIGRALQFSSRDSHAPTRAAACFSTTAAQHKRRPTKDNNRNRGVSSLYRSGPREPLSMSGIPLPKPRDYKPTVPHDPTHGLWGFFPEVGKALWTPAETEQHGRAWTVEELRKKSWEDLHALWWVCCKERNMLSTSQKLLEKAEIGFGESEINTRDQEIRKTMRGIKHTLTERYYTWQDAVDVARDDPEINLNPAKGQGAYQPPVYDDELEGVEKGMREETLEAIRTAEKVREKKGLEPDAIV